MEEMEGGGGEQETLIIAEGMLYDNISAVM